MNKIVWQIDRLLRLRLCHKDLGHDPQLGLDRYHDSIKPCMRCVLPVFHAFRHEQHSCFERFSLAGAQQRSNKAGNGERVQLVLYFLFS